MAKTKELENQQTSSTQTFLQQETQSEIISNKVKDLEHQLNQGKGED